MLWVCYGAYITKDDGLGLMVLAACDQHVLQVRELVSDVSVELRAFAHMTGDLELVDEAVTKVTRFEAFEAAWLPGDPWPGEWQKVARA